MPEPNAAPSPAQPRSHLHPLQAEGRYREPSVEAQIVRLIACPSAEFWRQVRLSDHHAADFVAPEALVYLLRERFRNGDQETAWKLAELLIERNARFVYQLVACWKQLTPYQSEDCLRDIQTRMLHDLFDLGRGAEFWEVRFYVCLKRRAQNIIEKYRMMARTEVILDPLDDGEGHATDRLETIAGPETMTAEVRAQLREALSLLTEQERTAFVLTHYEGWSQDQIAQRLGVVDRTVRNLLTRAEGKLASWRNAHGWGSGDVR